MKASTHSPKTDRKVQKTFGIGMLGYAFMGKSHSNAFARMQFFFYPAPAIPRLVTICGERCAPKVRASGEGRDQGL